MGTKSSCSDTVPAAPEPDKRLEIVLAEALLAHQQSLLDNLRSRGTVRKTV